MPHGIEADRVQRKRLLDGGGDFFEREGLQQPQYLDVLAAGVLAQSRLQQPAQLSEALRQLPAGKRRGLVQSAALVFEQSQVVQRIVDGSFAFVAALVFGDDLAPRRRSRCGGRKP